MIQNVPPHNRRIPLRASERLRLHFLSLARRVAAWRTRTAPATGNAIGIASLETRSGGSTVALNLAAALAGISRGNVLLVDSSFSKGGPTRRTARPGPGYAESLASGQAPANCIAGTTIERLFLMPCGQVNPRSAIELPFENTRNLNCELADSFEWVVYDLPVVSDMTHFYPLAQCLDGIVLVADARRIPEEKIHRTARRLEELETPLIGLALNKV
jgi:Mrp family chromosome partitioning ATPase